MRTWIRGAALVAALAGVGCSGSKDKEPGPTNVAPVVSAFWPAPTSVAQGSPTDVTWTWTYANSPSPTPTCTIDHGVGTVTSGSATSVNVSASTTFTLSCTNAAGTDTAQTTIAAVGPVAPVVIGFRATPSWVTPGSPTDVTWTWQFVDPPVPTPTCTIDNGVGTVTDGAVTSVDVDTDTTFTLTCTNAAGSRTAQTIVWSTGSSRADFVSIVAASAHTCGLTTAGIAYCWGSNASGQLGNGLADASTPRAVDTSTITGNKAFVQLALGDGHSCGLTVEGVAYCWGSDISGELGNGSATAGTSAASPSAVDTSTIPGNKAFVQLTAGGNHTCGLTVAGAAYCWGAALSGALGNGATGGFAYSPAAVLTTTIPGDRSFVELAAGAYHTCGRTADGAAYCWGSDAYGQLGDGSGSQNRASPSAVDTATIAGNKAFLRLTAGAGHTCAIMADGATYCWGHDFDGQLGDGNTRQDTQSPSALDGSAIPGNRAFVQLSAGAVATCGIAADGVAYCWGYDAYGTLGNGATVASTGRPSAVDTTTLSGNPAFVQTTTGGIHACGLTADGLAYCWGRDNRGQLGDGGAAADVQTASAVAPVPRVGNRQFASLVTGTFHACGLTTAGRAYCWGDDYNGQLGNGAALTADVSLPSEVDASTITGNAAFKQLTTLGEFTCGLTATGAAYCWGDDGSWGKLGNGAASSASQPSPSAVDVSGIPGNKAFVQLSASRWHACGLTVEGVAYCWGLDMYGQLGNGAPLAVEHAPAPVDTSGISGNKAFVAVTAGNVHTCALTADGVAYCWGSDGSGGLGTSGAPTNSPVPVPVDTSAISGDRRFLRLNAGSGWTCGITADGASYCWGYDGEGELGNGAAGGTQTPTPIDVSALSGNAAFVEFAADWIHTCARTVEGVAYCWGSDMNGGLGNGAPAADQVSPSPVDVSALSGNTRFVQVSTGALFSCGRAADGVAYCWGQDGDGQLGNGAASTGDLASPSAVDTSGL